MKGCFCSSILNRRKLEKTKNGFFRKNSSFIEKIHLGLKYLLSELGKKEKRKFFKWLERKEFWIL